MARLLSLPVLGGGALAASPALWAAFVDGTMPTETALVRWAVGIAVVWVGLTLLRSLVEGTAAPSRRTDDGAPRSLPAGDGAVPVRAAVVDSPGDAA